MTSHTILVVEEDAAIRAFLADQLTADGYIIHATADPDRALGLCATQLPDAALIDVNGGSGRTFAATVRSRSRRGVDPRLALILLGTAAGELDAVRAFDAGADDYVLKPFSYPELRARLRALLTRVDMHSRSAQVLAVGGLRIDVTARRVTVNGQEMHVSKKEFTLLRTLAAEPTRVFTKEELLRTIWGHRAVGSTRTLDSHACRLRHKLDAHGGRYILNLWGVGYRLTDDPGAVRDRGQRTLAA
ncbi:MAG TPA: response regulator transcription factor [Solirubrobacteraceae bacterium]|jgi:DNA-binding response OmpR family regulator|nr:response regulator transcription factor [Solirubrobacteraceae bacterium]